MYNEGDQEIPLAQIIKKKYGLPCVDNDVKAATIAEKEFGIGKDTDDFVCINIGTGIAAGFVCNGRLLSGVHNNAGEIGHMVSTCIATYYARVENLVALKPLLLAVVY